MEEHISAVIERIQERNRRVEADKAWETSVVRISTIAVVTYICAVLVMYVIEVERPLLAAFIPALGYVLSTQSLPFLKSWWLSKRG